MLGLSPETGGHDSELVKASDLKQVPLCATDRGEIR